MKWIHDYYVVQYLWSKRKLSQVTFPTYIVVIHKPHVLLFQEMMVDEFKAFSFASKLFVNWRCSVIGVDGYSGGLLVCCEPLVLDV